MTPQDDFLREATASVFSTFFHHFFNVHTSIRVHAIPTGTEPVYSYGIKFLQDSMQTGKWLSPPPFSFYCILNFALLVHWPTNQIVCHHHPSTFTVVLSGKRRVFALFCSLHPLPVLCSSAICLEARERERGSGKLPGGEGGRERGSALSSMDIPISSVVQCF